jgi:hypothetical protein
MFLQSRARRNFMALRVFTSSTEPSFSHWEIDIDSWSRRVIAAIDSEIETVDLTNCDPFAQVDNLGKTMHDVAMRRLSEKRCEVPE